MDIDQTTAGRSGASTERGSPFLERQRHPFCLPGIPKFINIAEKGSISVLRSQP